MDIEMLIDKYQLNNSEADVLRFMWKNRQSLKNLGIRDVAKASYVSTATIIQMAKKIGFTGYSELVFSVGNQRHRMILPKICSDKEKETFIRLMSDYQDRRMMILGSGFSQNIANYFSEALNLHGFRATANSHLEFLRENVQSDILLFIISNSGDTVRLAELANLATLTISTETYAPKRISDYQPNLFFGTTLNQFEILLSEALLAIFS